MQKYPRVLILGNECLSNTTSNGRTLRNFLIGWPKNSLAQFYLRGNQPDFTVCEHYYRVSDGAALRAFLTGKATGGFVTMASEQAVDVQSKKSAGKKRNALTMLVRDIVWNSMRWAGQKFYTWVEEYSPEVILLQAGDCAFMLRLARKLAKHYCIPLVIYNSEGYYFKNYDYFRAEGFAKWIYPLFHRYFCREFEKTVSVATKSIYCCEKLKTDYDRVFHKPSETIHTATDVNFVPKNREDEQLVFSYLGNLGVGRHTGLVEIGNTLSQISPILKLDIYGNIPNDVVKKAFAECPGIRYHGFVSYERVQEIMKESDVLIHTESFDPFYREDLKYGFSTKIADSLASGRSFLLYAPREIACAEYLRNHKAAWVVDQKEDLESILRQICHDHEVRNAYVNNARNLAQLNHDACHNRSHFRQMLCDCVKE